MPLRVMKLVTALVFFFFQLEEAIDWEISSRVERLRWVDAMKGGNRGEIQGKIEGHLGDGDGERKRCTNPAGGDSDDPDNHQDETSHVWVDSENHVQSPQVTSKHFQ